MHKDNAQREQLRDYLKSHGKLFSTDIFVSQVRELIKQIFA
jgi:hypothetical protein